MADMTDTEARAAWTRLAHALRDAGQPDAAARAELLREWTTNADFRRRLADDTWARTQHREDG